MVGSLSSEDRFSFFHFSSPLQNGPQPLFDCLMFTLEGNTLGTILTLIRKLVVQGWLKLGVLVVGDDTFRRTAEAPLGKVGNPSNAPIRPNRAGNLTRDVPCPSPVAGLGSSTLSPTPQGENWFGENGFLQLSLLYLTLI